jgi:hypothetical protein
MIDLSCIEFCSNLMKYFSLVEFKENLVTHILLTSVHLELTANEL